MPLKGMRVGVACASSAVKCTKNDEAISDQLDKEIKEVVGGKLGATLIQSVDPDAYSGRSQLARTDV